MNNRPTQSPIREVPPLVTSRSRKDPFLLHTKHSLSAGSLPGIETSGFCMLSLSSLSRSPSRTRSVTYLIGVRLYQDKSLYVKENRFPRAFPDNESFLSWQPARTSIFFEATIRICRCRRTFIRFTPSITRSDLRCLCLLMP